MRSWVIYNYLFCSHWTEFLRSSEVYIYYRCIIVWFGDLVNQEKACLDVGLIISLVLSFGRPIYQNLYWPFMFLFSIILIVHNFSNCNLRNMKTHWTCQKQPRAPWLYWVHPVRSSVVHGSPMDPVVGGRVHGSPIDLYPCVHLMTCAISN